MTPPQMSKVWSAVSLLLLYYALNAYLVTQGGEPVFGASLIMKTRVPAAFLAIPICSLLLLLGSLIGIVYARRNGPRWADRIPLVGFEQLNAATPEAKVYQGVMLVLLTLLPAIALVHFWQVAGSAPLVTTAPRPVDVPGGMWDWRGLTSLDNPASICSSISGPEDNRQCDGRTTILPGLEPMIFAAFTLAAFCVTLKFWWTVCASTTPPPADSHPLAGSSN
jgi:hypothetical protein